MSSLESLLVCYRYFKECRNSIVHHGKTATDLSVQKYSRYNNLRIADLGVNEIPECFPTNIEGKPIRLSLRGTVGFGEIVLRLISTLDAELSKTVQAEPVFVSRWASVIGSIRSLPSNTDDRNGAIVRLTRKLGLPAPVSPASLLPLLKRHNLVN
jgi:hypothetical protein